MSKSMIKLQNVQKAFSDYVLFNQFNLIVNAGEFVMITGASGCGKTTLLNMIGGLEPVTDGTIIVDELDITKMKNLKHYYRNTVGFIFQNFALIEQKTVEDNLRMVHPKGRTKITMEGALRSVGMEHSLKQKVYSLSGGEQQRIALARLRLKNCKLILADEPTGSLDRKNGKIVMDILHELNNEGKTVLMVTHDENLMQQGNKIVRLT